MESRSPAEIDLLRKRLEQWKALNRWQEREDPDRIADPSVALHWVGQTREMMIRWHGHPPASDDTGAGFILMRERLSRFRSAS